MEQIQLVQQVMRIIVPRGMKVIGSCFTCSLYLIFFNIDLDSDLLKWAFLLKMLIF